MKQKNIIKLFEEKKIRSLWDNEHEEWYFSVIDVCGALSESTNPHNYWKVLKNRLTKEGSELVTICNQLKMPSSDGKFYKTDVLNTKGILRLIQSIPSKNAEPFKMRLAEIGKLRIDQMQDPELSIQQAMIDYKKLGYYDNLINQRLKSIEVRKELTDEWKKHGLQEGIEFATLIDITYKVWAGKSAKEYKQFKGLKKENLRDNMTNRELVLNMLAKVSTKDISETSNPEIFDEYSEVAKRGGNVAKVAREQLEKELGHSVISPLNAKEIENKNNLLNFDEEER